MNQVPLYVLGLNYKKNLITLKLLQFKKVNKSCLLVFNRCFERQGNGAIVNIVCDMFRGFPMMSHTGAARAAVENLTR